MGSSALDYIYSYEQGQGWTVRIKRAGQLIAEQVGFESLPEAIAWRPRRTQLTIRYIDGVRATLEFLALREAFSYIDRTRHFGNIAGFSLRSIPFQPKAA